MRRSRKQVQEEAPAAMTEAELDAEIAYLQVPAPVPPPVGETAELEAELEDPELDLILPPG